MKNWATLADAVRASSEVLKKHPDRFPEAFATGTRGLVKGPTKLFEKALDKSIKTLTAAERVVLSSEFSAYVSKASVVATPFDLQKMMEFARMPYDTMWIEWDNTARSRIQYELSGHIEEFDEKEYSPRVGCLISPTGHEGAHIVEFFALGWDDKVVHFPTSMMVSFIEGARDVANKMAGEVLQPFRKTASDEEIAGMVNVFGLTEELVRPAVETSRLGGVVFLGRSYCKVMATLHGKKAVNAILDLSGHVTTSVSSTFMTVGFDIEELDRDFYRGILAESLMELSGDFRFLLVLMALMQASEGPRIIRTPSKGKRVFSGGRFMPAYEYKVLAIERPKFDIARTLKKIITHEVRHRRWHTVMGHWAYSRRYGDPGCDHSYIREVDEDGNPVGSDRHICTSCGHKKWFIKAHARGDSTIGVLDKGYEVKTPN